MKNNTVWNYAAEKKQAVQNLARKIHRLGYAVYIAESGQYGFFTNADGTRIVSFQIDFSWFDFSANHKSKGLGSGYRITNDGECPIYDLSWLTSDFCAKLISSPIYKSRKKNEYFISWTTLQQHLDFYGASSKYSLYVPSLREVCVYYSNGGKNNAPFCQCVNMAAHLTDEQINEYFSIGKSFNVGCGDFDLMATVEKVEIIK